MDQVRECVGRGVMTAGIEAFNVLNTPHFYLPVADLTSVRAGQVVRAYDGRQIQLGLRATF